MKEREEDVKSTFEDDGSSLEELFRIAEKEGRAMTLSYRPWQTTGRKYLAQVIGPPEGCNTIHESGRIALLACLRQAQKTEKENSRRK